MADVFTPKTLAERMQHTNKTFASQNNGTLPQPLYRETLQRSIAVKIARLINGEINDADSWLDIASYAMLVHQQMVEMEANITAEMKEA